MFSKKSVIPLEDIKNTTCLKHLKHLALRQNIGAVLRCFQEFSVTPLEGCPKHNIFKTSTISCVATR